jgi:large subunit ribosomal protein L10
VKAAVIDGKVYNAEQVVALSKVPPRPIVLGQVVGTLQAPLTGFAGTLNGVLSEFARTLQALTKKMESEAA